MLEVITSGFNKVRDRLQGKVELTESNIEDALRDIRFSLLEADVHLSVVKRFIAHVQEKAVGEVVATRVAHKGKKLKVSPADHFINICYEELVNLMGPVDVSLRFGSRPVAAIMLVGLQGCGKTTTAGKLASYLRSKNKKPLLVAADIYRPAAIEQLQVIGSSLGIPVYTQQNALPPLICKQALEHARSIGCDVAIFDTAGRLAIDDALMHELENIVAMTQPENTLLVCDAMIGQDAVKTAETFSRRLPVSGFILTKLDGDARGGAALSIKEVTGKPIKFLGTGEALDRLEEFRPEGLASRILGFGDVIGLMKDFEEVVDEKKAEEDAQRMLKGQFTLSDFLEQIQTIKKMGPLQDIVAKIPFFSQMAGNAVVDEREVVKVESIIRSMTPKERTQPDILNDSRKQRIARGSGRSIRDVNEILKRYRIMRDMMKNIGKSGLLSKFAQGLSNIPGLSGLPGMGTVMPPLSGGNPAAVARGLSDEQKKKLRKKRKEERKARKKNRRR
ncbi:MAG: signal recognition particle protein [Desulfobacterota bacterium]|nr:signal recognition particle protein [Thermodesulfobacteriota bacterium]